MNFLTALKEYKKKGLLPLKLGYILKKFYHTYGIALAQNKRSLAEYEPILNQFLDAVVHQLASPIIFEPYHKSVRSPIDYYKLGNDLLRPLIIFEKSHVLGLDHLASIQQQLQSGANVILFANHQTEPDPQAISLLLENSYAKLAEEMIFVAGHRVISDPLAIPLSLGRNLLCIHSKKYISHPLELKQEKLLYNQRTMKQMTQLLSEGGKCIYVAPSGGRDRPNLKGQIEIAKFDPQSIELFYLMSKQVDSLTHFYPLTLATYHLLPPPHSIKRELGENRHAQCTPLHMAFDAEINMEQFLPLSFKDKKQKRLARAEHIWQIVQKNYLKIILTT